MDVAPVNADTIAPAQRRPLAAALPSAYLVLKSLKFIGEFTFQSYKTRCRRSGVHVALVCRGRGSNPHVPFGTQDFHPATAFAARSGTMRFAVWTVPSPCPKASCGG